MDPANINLSKSDPQMDRKLRTWHLVWKLLNFFEKVAFRMKTVNQAGKLADGVKHTNRGLWCFKGALNAGKHLGL